MPLFKKKPSAQPMKAESLPMAMSVTRHNSKKMADGGMVDNSKKTLGEMIGYPGSTPPPVKKAMGGEVEEHYASIADAILAKKREASAVPMGDDGIGEDSDLADFPEVASDEIGDEDEPTDMVSAIRKKMRKS